MPIAFRCQQCGDSFNAADTLAGKKIKCRKCNAVISIPAPQAVKVSSAPKAAKPAPAKKVPASEPELASAAPAFDLLASSLDSLAPPARSPLMAAGPAYAPQARPKHAGKRRTEPLRGPGVIHSLMMVGGTGLLLLLSAGVYGAAGYFLPKNMNVAAPKTGAESVRGLGSAPGGNSPGTIPSGNDEEDWDE